METAIMALLSACVSFTAFSEPSRQAERLETAFLEEYLKGVQPLLTFYGHVRLRIRYTVTASGQRDVYEKLYYADDPRYRLDTIRIDRGRHSSGVVQPAGHSFTVQKSGESGRFSLVRITKQHEVHRDELRQSSPIPFGMYCMGPWPLAEWVRLPQVTVTAFRKKTREGQAVAILEYSYASDDSDQLQEECTQQLVFAVDQCWALCEARFVFRDGTKKVVRFAYKGSNGHVPLVAAVDSWIDGPDGARRYDLHGEVLEIVAGPVAKEEFTLAAFGLTNAGLRATVPPWYYWQLLAVVALVLTVVLRRVARHLRRAPSAGE